MPETLRATQRHKRNNSSTVESLKDEEAPQIFTHPLSQLAIMTEGTNTFLLRVCGYEEQ